MRATCSPSWRSASKQSTMVSGTCTSARCGSAAFTRRWVALSISWGGRCAAQATITKEGTTTKCYPSPEYKVLPITWTVHASPFYTYQPSRGNIVAELAPRCEHEDHTEHDRRVGAIGQKLYQDEG